MNRLFRSDKAKWAAGLSGVLWSVLFLGVCSLTVRSTSNVNFLAGFQYVFLAGSLVGFLLTAILVWAVLAGVDTIRHTVYRGKP